MITPKLRLCILMCSFGIMSCQSDTTDDDGSSSFNAVITPSKPNIILIMTDDQGYGDLGETGNPAVETPNINNLAKQSVRFRNFHVDPTCSPTRSALLTGKHSMRAGVWHTVMGRSFLAQEHKTVAEALLEAGYDTALFGKWHLGDNYPFRPQDQGFQTTVIHGGGGVGQSGDYWGNTQFNDVYYRDGKPEFFDGYATTTFFDEALTYIKDKAAQKKPFFAYIATNAPHSPFRAYDRDIQAYRDKGLPENMARFYAMITDIDKGVGRMREAVKELNIENNTIFIFMTDNGSSLSGRHFETPTLSTEQVTADYVKRYQSADWEYNAGMRGFKASVYEGGHRVPFYIYYPNGGIGEPRDENTLAAHYDLMPTLLEFANATSAIPKDIDGISLVSLLTKKQVLPERNVVVTNQRIDQPRIGRPTVVMNNDWRYVAELDKGIEELYQLSSDPAQINNLLTQKPAKAKEMRAALESWWNDVSKDVGPRVKPIAGTVFENPLRLNANDWMEAESTDVIAWYPGFKTLFINKDKEGWITNPEKYSSLPWHIDVAKSGEYEVSLYFHDVTAQTPVGKDLAVLELDGKQQQVELIKGGAGARFTVKLNKGALRLKGWFANANDQDGDHLPAFYAYVKAINPIGEK